MYVHRTIEPVIKKLLKQFSALALTGPRQTGKSTLLKNVFGNDYQYITFDDPLNRQRVTDDPELFMSSAAEYVIFDEIQYVPDFIPYLKLAIDGARSVKGKYILTGSQQFNLMKGLTDSLAGRIVLLTLYPFSFHETNTFNKEEDSLSYFENASLKGLYPELVVNKIQDAQMWFGSYLQTYLERDIRTIYNIGNLRQFTQFLHLLASRCSQQLNMSTYSREIGVSVNTIKSWISVLEAGNIIFLMPPYYKNLGKRISKSPKIYWVDNGLVSYLTGVHSKENLLYGLLAGALFENLVISETLKSFYNKGIRPSLYYLRTNNGLEIDLLIEYGNELYPFEIKMTRTPTPQMTKSLGRFTSLFNVLRLSEGHLVCLTDRSYAMSKNVRAVNIPNYLNLINKITG